MPTRTNDPLSAINLRQTPQSEKAKPEQVQNNAGGFVFTIDPMAYLRRFLVLGTTGGTYYQGEADLTKEATTGILDLVRTRGAEVLAEVVTISTQGRAPKPNPALFTMAALCSLADEKTRREALVMLPQVARTGTHLFTFVGYVEQFRGWGRGLRRGVSYWYETKDGSDLAYQMAKYQSREGWAHKDILRLAHPEATSPVHKSLYDWACGRIENPVGNVHLTDTAIGGMALAFESGADVADLVSHYPLSWEMLPSESLKDPKVWEALMERKGGLPLGALLRQLPRLTNLGLVQPLGGSLTTEVVRRLTDREGLKKARIHPVNVLVALRTYAGGQAFRGDSTWSPSRPIVDALDEAFYTSFDFVEPTNKRTLLALDVSGSMSTASISGMPLTAREASAALAMVTARTETNYEVVGFTGGASGYGWGRSVMPDPRDLSTLDISPRQRLDDVIRTVSGLTMGRTDCALPMVWATSKGVSVDTFVIYTDNETWVGGIHPHQALEQYRQKSGINARLIVVGMTATPFSIADPSDPGMLDVAGFDSAVPGLIADFSRGDI